MTKIPGLEGFDTPERRRASSETTGSITPNARIVLTVGFLQKTMTDKFSHYYLHFDERKKKLAVTFYKSAEEAKTKHGIEKPYTIQRFKDKATGKLTTGYLEAKARLKAWGYEMIKKEKSNSVELNWEPKLQILYIDLSGKIQKIKKP